MFYKSSVVNFDQVPLLKISQNVPDITLPYTGFQLIMRPMPFLTIQQIDEIEIIQTSRGEKGFGSTNKI